MARATSESKDAVATRIAVRTSDIGLPAPHAPVRVKLDWSDGSALLVVPRASPHPLVHLAPWIEALGARVIHTSDVELRINFPDLSDRWARLFRNVRLDVAELLPDGTAFLELTATRGDLGTFTRHLAQEGSAPRVERIVPARLPPPLLTPAQDEAIRAAAAHGYYHVPRPINLHELAARLGVGSASLSERLRRAEQRLVNRYVGPQMESTTAPHRERREGSAPTDEGL